MIKYKVKTRIEKINKIMIYLDHYKFRSIRNDRSLLLFRTSYFGLPTIQRICCNLVITHQVFKLFAQVFDSRVISTNIQTKSITNDGVLLQISFPQIYVINRPNYNSKYYKDFYYNSKDYTPFFISNTFVSNARLKLTKKSSKC